MNKKHVELNRLRAEIKTENKRLNLEKVNLLCDVEDKINEMLIGYGDSKLTAINFSDISLLRLECVTKFLRVFVLKRLMMMGRRLFFLRIWKKVVLLVFIHTIVLSWLEY